MRLRAPVVGVDVPTHVETHDGFQGRVVSWNGGNGWVTVRWSDGKQADYFRPSTRHEMTYMVEEGEQCPT